MSGKACRKAHRAARGLLFGRCGQATRKSVNVTIEVTDGRGSRNSEVSGKDSFRRHPGFQDVSNGRRRHGPARTAARGYVGIVRSLAFKTVHRHITVAAIGLRGWLQTTFVEGRTCSGRRKPLK